MRFQLDDRQVADGTVLIFGIRYVDPDNLDGPGASRSKVFTYVALKAGGRWFFSGTGRVPQDAGWGAVARWLADPTREVVFVDTVTSTARLYPAPNPPASALETAEADGRDVHDPPW